MRIFMLGAVAFAFFVTPSRAETFDIPLDMSGVRPAVSVTINGGASELWVFDTGAGGTIMDITHARALGLAEEQPVRIGSPAGGTPQEGFLTTVQNMTVGGHALESVRVVAAPAALPDRGGVLSPLAFSGQLVTFDFAHTRVRVADKTPANTPTSAAMSYGGTGRGHALPSIPVTFGDQNWSAHMDTGSPGALTFPYMMAASLPLAAPPVQTGHAHFVDGDHARYGATLNGRVQVGPLTLDNPQVEFIDGLPSINIGMRLLSQMTITIDPEAQQTWAVAAN